MSIKDCQRDLVLEHTPLSYGLWKRESVRNTSKNLIKRTILFFARGNSRYCLVAGSTGLGRDQTISGQRIPPCLPAGAEGLSYISRWQREFSITFNSVRILKLSKTCLSVLFVFFEIASMTNKENPPGSLMTLVPHGS